MRRYIPIPQLEPKHINRIFARIRFDPSGCWMWTGEVTKWGYAQVVIRRQRYKVHRVLYHLCVGPIPERMGLDHLCHDKTQCFGGNTCPHRRCVNPDHLEPVTQLINTQRGVQAESRKQTCPNGHAYDCIEAGTRRCMKCRNENRRASYYRRRTDLLEAKRRHYALHRDEILTHRRQVRCQT